MIANPKFWDVVERTGECDDVALVGVVVVGREEDSGAGKGESSQSNSTSMSSAVKEGTINRSRPRSGVISFRSKMNLVRGRGGEGGRRGREERERRGETEATNDTSSEFGCELQH